MLLTCLSLCFAAVSMSRQARYLSRRTCQALLKFQHEEPRPADRKWRCYEMLAGSELDGCASLAVERCAACEAFLARGGAVITSSLRVSGPALRVL